LGTKKEAGWFCSVSRTACGTEPEAFVGFSSPQNCRRTKGAMGKVPLTTKGSSLI
jgi:hypothetical protein